MIVQTSRSVRRLIARLERGESVLAALASIARTHEVMAAGVRGTGVLDEVSLAPFDPERGGYGPPRVLRGRIQLVSLDGSIAWEANAPGARLAVVLARETDRGLELLGGRLEAAKVVAVELVIECWDDVTLERVLDGTTGLDVWSIEGGSTAAPTPPRAAPVERREVRAESPVRVPVHAPVEEPRAAVAPRTLTDAARTLESMPQRPPPDDLGPAEPEPVPGDLLEHPSFGVVEVEALADQDRLRIKLPSGSRREILLEVFEITRRDDRDGHRVWALRPRRR